MLAEGLVHTFESLSAEGFDRVVRVQTLAVAMQDKTLIAWASAWRAHLQSERSDFIGMARSLDLALTAADATEHDAIARASMVLANAYSTCGREDIAIRWYASSRHHALEVGDHATIDALIYNKAAFALGRLRAEACFGSVDEAVLAHVRAEINSAKNYQNLAGISAVTNFVTLWEARINLLRGEYVNAIRLFVAVRDQEPFGSYNYDASLIDLEIAYCHFRLGDKRLAMEIESKCINNFTALHCDEQLVAAWLRFEMTDSDARPAAAAMQYAALTKAKLAYEDEQLELKTALQQFDGRLPPGIPSTVLDQVGRLAR